MMLVPIAILSAALPYAWVYSYTDDNDYDDYILCVYSLISVLLIINYVKSRRLRAGIHALLCLRSLALVVL